MINIIKPVFVFLMGWMFQTQYSLLMKFLELNQTLRTTMDQSKIACAVVTL
jgi:hypothetical protein